MKIKLATSHRTSGNGIAIDEDDDQVICIQADRSRASA
jgi:hypothetical protein